MEIVKLFIFILFLLGIVELLFFILFSIVGIMEPFIFILFPIMGIMDRYIFILFPMMGIMEPFIVILFPTVGIMGPFIFTLFPIVVSVELPNHFPTGGDTQVDSKQISLVLLNRKSRLNYVISPNAILQIRSGFLFVSRRSVFIRL